MLVFFLIKTMYKQIKSCALNLKPFENLRLFLQIIVAYLAEPLGVFGP